MRKILLTSWCAGVMGLVLGASAVLPGCEEEPAVRVYDVPRDEPTPAVPAGDASGPPPMLARDGTSPTPTEPGGASSAKPWTLPEGWRELPGERPMRVATLSAGEGDAAVEIAISRFPGDVGGLLANVNRWRGQLGLPPIDASQLPDIVKPVEGPGYGGHWMRLEGPAEHMLAAALPTPAGEATWFVKAQAEPDRLDRIVESFVQFVRNFGTGADPAR